MHNTCDILILTANFGSGHISVSKAIEGYIHGGDDRIRVHIVDMYEVIRPILHTWMYKGFHLLVKYAVPLYNYDYYKKNNSDGYNKLHTCKSSLKKLAEYLQEVQPSLIISTFPTCSSYIATYKEKYNDDIPLITCITDVVKGNEWINHGDGLSYLVATHEVENSLISKGIKNEQVLTTGIPIRPEFLEKKDRLGLRQENDIVEDEFVILMMGGGLGLIPDTEDFYRWIENHKSIRLYIITGHNKELYKKIEKYNNGRNIHVLSYTDKIADMMAYADLLITKPGGITLFEALSSDLPFIIYKPILGQECENGKYIEEKKLGMIVHSEDALKAAIIQFMQDEKMGQDIRQHIEKEKSQIDMEAMVQYILDILNVATKNRGEISC